MTNLSPKFNELLSFIIQHKIVSVSFDIDGTLYPIRKVQLKWWLNLLSDSRSAWKFLKIKREWELRRKGNSTVPVSSNDVEYFEAYLVSMLNPSLVPEEIKDFIQVLKSKNIAIYFLSDHGAKAKLAGLHLDSEGTPVNCLIETQELKPHEKISRLLRDKYLIRPETHLHLGDRWTDEEQARIFGCHFKYHMA